jgi:hypothetical protein
LPPAESTASIQYNDDDDDGAESLVTLQSTARPLANSTAAAGPEGPELDLNFPKKTAAKAAKLLINALANHVHPVPSWSEFATTSKALKLQVELEDKFKLTS